MTTLIKDTSAATYQIRDFGGSYDSVLVQTPNIVIVVPGSSSTVTVEDASLNQQTGATTNTTQNLNINIPLNISTLFHSPTPNYTSTTPSIATVNSSTGATTYVSNGTASISINIGILGKQIATFQSIQNTPVTTTTFNNFVSGSLGIALTNTITTDITGKTPSAATQNIFSSSSPPSSFTRNTGIFTGAVDLTPIPAYCSGGNAKFMGALITPQHLLSCNHAQLGIGETVYFVDNSNVVTSRTISATTNIAGSDIQLYQLNSVVASGITFASVLPANYRSYLPQPQYGYPCVFTNQSRTMQIGDLWIIPPAPTEVGIQQSTNTARAAWWSSVISGDSGSPAFMIIGGILVLICTWHTSNLNNDASGPSVADYITQINTALTAFGSSYQLTTANLAAYNTY